MILNILDYICKYIKIDSVERVETTAENQVLPGLNHCRETFEGHANLFIFVLCPVLKIPSG